MAEHKIDKDDRDSILKHIDLMHSMVTKENFETYWSLFKTKYSKYPSYIEYFQKTYIDSEFSKWHFFDVPPNTLLTNNISESLNAMIKSDWTNRERKPLHIFFKSQIDS